MKSWEKNSLGIISSLLLAACQSEPPLNKETAIPKVTVAFLAGEALKAGELKKAILTISNTTLEPILIQNVELIDQLPALRRGLQSLPGSLIEKQATHQFLYDPAG